MERKGWLFETYCHSPVSKSIEYIQYNPDRLVQFCCLPADKIWKSIVVRAPLSDAPGRLLRELYNYKNALECCKMQYWLACHLESGFNLISEWNMKKKPTETYHRASCQSTPDTSWWSGHVDGRWVQAIGSRWHSSIHQATVLHLSILSSSSHTVIAFTFPK